MGDKVETGEHVVDLRRGDSSKADLKTDEAGFESPEVGEPESNGPAMSGVAASGVAASGVAASRVEPDELEDTAEETTYRLVPLEVGLLTNPTVLRAVAGIVLGLMIVMWPERSDRILARLVGLGLAWFAITTMRVALKRRKRSLLAIGSRLIVLGVGMWLVAGETDTADSLGRVLAFVIALLAVRRMAAGRGGDPLWQWLVPSLALLAGAALLATFPEAILTATTTVAALAWIGVSALVIILSLDARTGGVATYSSASEVLASWFVERPKAVDTRRALYSKILFEGPATSHRIVRFFVLMGFASVIASMGVITDSTAVVIGAMLIAPLMTPLMGMAISLVMGWPNRLTRSAIIAFSGIAFAISIGVLLGLTVPATIDVGANSQILARTSPTILDLITAIAAGAAGAYGLSRPDVSDSLPGVAIAISLVPPLAVVGISYSQGEWAAGNGALLLFLTNMIAILVVGGLTFIATGVTPIQRMTENQHRVRTAVGAVCLASALVLGGLFLNGTKVATNLFEEGEVTASVEAWLESDEAHRVVSSGITKDDVSVVVIGSSDGLPAVATLADDLSQRLGRIISVDVHLVVEERFTATGS